MEDTVTSLATTLAVGLSVEGLGSTSPVALWPSLPTVVAMVECGGSIVKFGMDFKWLILLQYCSDCNDSYVGILLTDCVEVTGVLD